jgi:hypothetical protein
MSTAQVYSLRCKAYLSITEFCSNNAGLFYGSLQRLFKTLLYRLIPSVIGPSSIVWALEEIKIKETRTQCTFNRNIIIY